jgi:hypothetical protein
MKGFLKGVSFLEWIFRVVLSLCGWSGVHNKYATFATPNPLFQSFSIYQRNNSRETHVWKRAKADLFAYGSFFNRKLRLTDITCKVLLLPYL